MLVSMRICLCGLGVKIVKRRRVFGSSIPEQLKMDKSSPVEGIPSFLAICISAILDRGMVTMKMMNSRGNACFAHSCEYL
jgi:hypothetical protein